MSTMMEHLVAKIIMTHIVPDVVGTMGMSSASVGMDHGIWNCGASSRITMFLWTCFSSRSKRHIEPIRRSDAKSYKEKRKEGAKA